MEIEAKGFCEALDRLRPKPPTPAVRGISDVADEEKSLLERHFRDGWRRYAAQNAARFLLGLIYPRPEISRGLPLAGEVMRWPFAGKGMLTYSSSIVAASAKVLEESATPDMQSHSPPATSTTARSANSRRRWASAPVRGRCGPPRAAISRPDIWIGASRRRRDSSGALQAPDDSAPVGFLRQAARVDCRHCACTALRGCGVIDAAVMPAVTSTSTNVPTIMTDEKGAAMIKAPRQRLAA